MCSVAIDKTSKQSSNYLVFIYIYIYIKYRNSTIV